jgi:GAF domain-containing protein/anti-sigma regulatory factor (Ser/Thr protein kinase)
VKTIRDPEPLVTVAGDVDRTEPDELRRTSELIARTTLRLLRARVCLVHRLDRAARRAVCVAAAGEGDLSRWVGEAFPPDSGLAGRAMTEGVLVATGDILADRSLRLPANVLALVQTGAYRSGIAVPLIARGEILGALFLGDAVGREFGEEERHLLAAFADHAAIAFENARLHAAALDRVRQLAALVGLNRALTETLDPGQVAATALEAAQTLFPGAVGHIWEVVPGVDELELRDARGLPAHSVSRRRFGEGLPGAVAVARTPLVIPNVLHDERMLYRDWLAAEGLVSAIGLPLLHAGELYGTLNLFTRTRHDFSPEEVSLLQSFAAQAAVAMANARLHDVAIRRRREAEVLADLTRDISASLDLGAVLQRVADGARELCNADLARIALRAGGRDALRFRYFAGGRDDRDVNIDLQPGQGVGGQVLASGQPCRILDDPDDLRDRSHADAIPADRLHALMGVPILIDGQVEGLVFVDRRAPSGFTDHDEAVLQRLADHAAIAICNARLHQETERRLRETEGLLSVAQALASSLDAVEIARRTARQTTKLLGADSSIFFLLDESGEQALAVAGYRLPAVARVPNFSFALVNMPPAIRQSLEEGKPVATDDMPGDQRFHHPLFQPGAVRPRSVLHVPVTSRGRVRGMIVTLWWTASHSVTDDEIRLVQGAAAQSVLALDNARLYQQAQQALAELEATQAQLLQGELLRGLGKLAAGAAHHLNNLLAVVWGRVQLLLRQEPDAALRRSLEIIEKAAKDAADVVHRLQQFARSEPASKAQPLGVNDLVVEAIEMTRVRWHDLAQAQGIPIDMQFRRGEVPAVAGDPVSIREAIMNVLLNAVEALPTGGHITVTTGSADGVVEIEITDNGMGMSPEVLRRAPEPFFTTKGVKATGLGLSVTHSVLQRHGGELVMESAPKGGTTVTLRLPAIAAEAGAPGPVVGGGVDAPLRILVVDDEPDLREVLVTMLAEDGHTVSPAESGAAALAALQGQAVDLVITDLGMPDMNGCQLAEQVKARWPGVKVGIVTGWGERPETLSASHPAVDFVLGKPFSIESLRRSIARISR